MKKLLITGDSLSYNRYDYDETPRTNGWDCHIGMQSWSFKLRNSFITSAAGFKYGNELEISGNAIETIDEKCFPLYDKKDQENKDCNGTKQTEKSVDDRINHRTNRMFHIMGDDNLAVKKATKKTKKETAKKTAEKKLNAKKQNGEKRSKKWLIALAALALVYVAGTVYFSSLFPRNSCLNSSSI